MNPSSNDSLKVIDLSSLVEAMGVEVDTLAEQFKLLSSMIFNSDASETEAVAYINSAVDFMPTADMRTQFEVDYANHSRKKKENMKIVITAKDFRSYPSYTLHDEDDFL